MNTAKLVADLIQLSIEDDVEDVTSSEGNDKRAWLEVTVGNHTYKITIQQQAALAEEGDVAVDDEEGDDGMDGMQELVF